MEQKPQGELTDSYRDPTFDPKGAVLDIFTHGIPREQSPDTDCEGTNLEASDASNPTDGC